ncbi:MAG: PhoH family protein [Deltaproteobacteria bacterium]|nr:PhoH family protein [Deltaproteobacteria bacterium]MBI2974793.1 PhoH family protein [Deltaproteobacteria bacterium]
MRTKEITMHIDSNEHLKALLGVHDEYLKMIEDGIGVTVLSRGNTLRIIGSHQFEAELGERVLQELYGLLKRGVQLDRRTVEQAISFLTSNKDSSLSDIFLDNAIVSYKGHFITPKTNGQKTYLDAINKYDMVFGIGPAGTGKTFLAMAAAVRALLKSKYDRIILTRPAVEAGEKLGFLPGSMQEKVNPYLRPLYDALHDMMDIEQAKRLIDDGRIEVAPLAFMRGRTLNSAFVILDEAQNCTSEQMKMFLTRLGFDSKVVVTADVTQVDLPRGTASGALEAERVLKRVPGISFQYLTDVDVVRHPLVQAIVRAYNEDAKRQKSS